MRQASTVLSNLEGVIASLSSSICQVLFKKSEELKMTRIFLGKCAGFLQFLLQDQKLSRNCFKSQYYESPVGHWIRRML